MERHSVDRKKSERKLYIPGFVATLLIVLFTFTAPNVRASSAPFRVLVFGDDLSAGYGVPTEHSFPARLEARLRSVGIDVRVVNAGQSGDTTAGGLARLDWSLADKPDLVILELGANDMLRGVDPAAVRANLDKMIGKIKASGARLLLVGMRASPNWGDTYQKAFDRIYPELARAHGVALYPFFLDGVAMDPDLNQPDGLHPNARGVARIVERIAPRGADLLGDARPWVVVRRSGDSSRPLTPRIPLVEEGGVYKIPVFLNGIGPLPFVIDSGAADVSVTADIFLTLRWTGTISENDYIGHGQYQLADGSECHEPSIYHP